jgi:thioredoxin-related protein
MKLLTFLLMLFTLSVSAQKKNGNKNLLSFNALRDSMKIQPKPVFFKISTQWCSYCKIQDAQIRKDEKVRILLSSDYYWVELDAENKDDIVFNGLTYKYSQAEGVNELASILGSVEGRLAYPILMVLNVNYEKIFINQGLIEGKHLYQILDKLKKGK